MLHLLNNPFCLYRICDLCCFCRIFWRSRRREIWSTSTLLPWCSVKCSNSSSSWRPGSLTTLTLWTTLNSSMRNSRSLSKISGGGVNNKEVNDQFSGIINILMVHYHHFFLLFTNCSVSYHNCNWLPVTVYQWYIPFTIIYYWILWDRLWWQFFVKFHICMNN